MKSLIHILILLALFAIGALPQDKFHNNIFPEKFSNERLQKVHNANVDVLQRINEIHSLLLKSQNNTWQTALINTKREFYEEEGFNEKDTRKTINKTLLGDGFLMIEEYEQYWDSSAWVNYQKISYTYDGNNNLNERLLQDWDGFGWVTHFKASYTYDGNNNQIEELVQHWNGSAWVNDSKLSETYDGNNNLTEEFFQFWMGFTWENVQKYLYAYDGNNNLTKEIYQKGLGSVWENFSKRSYTYDVNNNKIKMLYQRWYGSAWVIKYKYSYKYDGKNNLTEALKQSRDGSDWVNVRKWIYSYIPTDVEEITGEFNDYSLSNNYPNPFNPSTNIQFNISEPGGVSLIVYDILGNEIATVVDEYKPAGSYEIEFNAKDLPSGIYFYRLQAGAFVETKKMVLLK